MKKPILILFSLSLAAVCFAENSTAFKIVKILNTPIFHTAPGTSLSDKEMKAELERRRVAQDKAEHAMSAELEKAMSVEELEQTLEFLTSPAGRKFVATMNGKPVLDEINQPADE